MGLLICKQHREKINVISDIEKLLKWLPVIFARMKIQWMWWSNLPNSNSRKLHWYCLVENGNSGNLYQLSRICSTPIPQSNVFACWWTSILDHSQFTWLLSESPSVVSHSFKNSIRRSASLWIAFDKPNSSPESKKHNSFLAMSAVNRVQCSVFKHSCKKA